MSCKHLHVSWKTGILTSGCIDHVPAEQQYRARNPGSLNNCGIFEPCRGHRDPSLLKEYPILPRNKCSSYYFSIQGDRSRGPRPRGIHCSILRFVWAIRSKKSTKGIFRFKLHFGCDINYADGDWCRNASKPATLPKPPQV